MKSKMKQSDLNRSRMGQVVRYLLDAGWSLSSIAKYTGRTYRELERLADGY